MIRICFLDMIFESLLSVVLFDETFLKASKKDAVKVLGTDDERHDGSGHQ